MLAEQDRVAVEDCVFYTWSFRSSHLGWSQQARASVVLEQLGSRVRSAVLDTRMAKKKGPGRPEPEVLQGHKRVVSFVDGVAYALSGSTGSRITQR